VGIDWCTKVGDLGENQKLSCMGSVFTNESQGVVDLGSGDPVGLGKILFEGMEACN
jgi:hypothetical protein